MSTVQFTVSVGTSHDIKNDLTEPISSILMNKIKGEGERTSVVLIIEEAFVNVPGKWRPPSVLSCVTPDCSAQE